MIGLPEKKIEKYRVLKTDFLKFKIIDKNKINIDTLKKFNFSLDGSILYNRIFNDDEFKELVKGKKSSELNTLLKEEYPNFDIEISITPFWMFKVPEDVQKIKIEKK